MFAYWKKFAKLFYIDKLWLWIQSFLGILGVALWSVEHEIYIAKGTDKNYDIRKTILIFNMIITAILITTIFFS